MKHVKFWPFSCLRTMREHLNGHQNGGKPWFSSWFPPVKKISNYSITKHTCSTVSVWIILVKDRKEYRKSRFQQKIIVKTTGLVIKDGDTSFVWTQFFTLEMATKIRLGLKSNISGSGCTWDIGILPLSKTEPG